jgi:hypothetical protein
VNDGEEHGAVSTAVELAVFMPAVIEPVAAVLDALRLVKTLVSTKVVPGHVTAEVLNVAPALAAVRTAPALKVPLTNLIQSESASDLAASPSLAV